MTLLEFYSTHMREMAEAIAHCFHVEVETARAQRRCTDQARMTLLNKMFSQLPPMEQQRCRDHAAWLRIQSWETRQAEPMIRADLAEAGARHQWLH